eukprot:6194640-Pleurochrysis_carterae.AAC.3
MKGSGKSHPRCLATALCHPRSITLPCISSRAPLAMKDLPSHCSPAKYPLQAMRSGEWQGTRTFTTRGATATQIFVSAKCYEVTEMWAAGAHPRCLESVQKCIVATYLVDLFSC